MIPTSFNASRSHSSDWNFIFLWGGQVHLFSYSRIESESTTTLVTKAPNTRLKQQTFQPTETKKFLNLYFITLGAFHSPSCQGVAWFKGKKIPFENTFTIVTLPLIHLVHQDHCFQFHQGEGEVVFEGAKEDGRCIWAMWEWWIKQKQSPNLHLAKESYICNANFVHIGVFVCMNLLVGGVRWSGAIGTLGRSLHLPYKPLESTLSDEKLFIAELSRAKRNTMGKKMW